MKSTEDKMQEKIKIYSTKLTIKNNTSKPLEFLPEPMFYSGKLADGQKFQDVTAKGETVVIMDPSGYRNSGEGDMEFHFYCTGWVMFTHEIMRLLTISFEEHTTECGNSTVNRAYGCAKFGTAHSPSEGSDGCCVGSSLNFAGIACKYEHISGAETQFKIEFWDLH